MNKTVKILLVSLGVITVASVVIYFIQKGGSGNLSNVPAPVTDTSTYVNIIVGAKKYSNATALATFGADFLQAWSDAVLASKSTFIYKGAVYNVQGGTKA